MVQWCDNCSMGEEGLKGCPGYSKLAHKDCTYYLPMRLDGSVKEAQMNYECDYCGAKRNWNGKCPNCFSKKRPSQITEKVEKKNE